MVWQHKLDLTISCGLRLMPPPAAATSATPATMQCKKVVWMGPKSYAAISLLEGLFTDGRTKPTPLQSSRNKEEGHTA